MQLQARARALQTALYVICVNKYLHMYIFFVSLLDEQQVTSHHQARQTHIRALPFSYSAQFPAYSFEACVFA
jgi:hypothetical protein